MNREVLEIAGQGNLIRLVQAQMISALTLEIEFPAPRASELEACRKSNHDASQCTHP
jgi:hypothetical protein